MIRGLLLATLLASAPLAGHAQEEGAVSLPGTRRALEEGTGPVRIVCFGDSVTGVYYHTGGRRAYADMLEIALQRLYPDAEIEVVNAGISGHATPDALARIDTDVLSHRPHLVTVMFGLNDMTRVPIDEYAANLSAIASRCRDVGAEVLFCTPNAVFDTEGRPESVLEEYVAAIHRVGAEMHVPVADCFAAFKAVRIADRFAFALLMSDEIHPNMDGHKLFAELLAQAIGGREVSLGDVGYPEPAMPKTRALLHSGEPVRIYAMPPYDTLVPDAIRACVSNAQLEVTVWLVEGKSLSEIEADAKAVRGMGVDLVVVAVPPGASADSPEQFVRSYSWIMNYALSFGHQEWDVIALPPSLATSELTGEAAEHDRLAQGLIHSQDLGTVVRAAADQRPAGELLAEWLRTQIADTAR
ncbi:MAG: hypothetical protein AMXMBFR82_23410 [Candidatus Hydrogenedentota bacterium]